MGRDSNKKRRAATDQDRRAKAAALRLEQQRAARRQRMWVIVAASIGVLAVVGAVIGYAVTRPPSTANRTPLTAAETAAIGSVSDATFTSVASAKTSLSPSGLPQTVTDTPLIVDGHPDLLYIGAEFCPYCAAERWALAVTLGRFGKLTGLENMHSSPTDTDPSTPTVTFLKAGYQSNYITFSHVEDEDINHNALQNPNASQAALWKKFTYDPKTGGESFPFIDFGNKYVIVGPTFDPSVLSGLTQKTIIADLNVPTSKVAQAIDSTANYMTAAVCGMTGNKPAAVCTPAVQALQKTFAKYTAPSSTTSSSS